MEASLYSPAHHGAERQELLADSAEGLPSARAPRPAHHEVLSRGSGHAHAIAVEPVGPIAQLPTLAFVARGLVEELMVQRCLQLEHIAL